MIQYITVVPSIRVIRGKDQFTYQTTSPVQVGELVWIPWRTRTLVGVVANVQAEPLAKAKPIVGSLQVILPAAYWRWLQWFSEYYYISLASAVHAALPSFVRRPKAAAAMPTASPATLRISQQRQGTIQATVQAILTARQTTTVLYQQRNELAAVLLGLIKQAKGPVVVLVSTEQALEYWQGVLAKQHLVVITAHHPLSVRRAWQMLIEHQAGVLLGTKRLALLPLTEADRVIVIDPEDPAHKQWDQNPRYHVQTVCEQQHQVIHFSYAPRMEQYAQQQLIDTLLTTAALPEVTIVQPIPGQVLTPSIIAKVEQANVVVIWHQRTGLGKSLVCASCKFWTQELNTVACPQCGSQSMRLAGFGTAMLKRRLAELFPQRPMIEVTASQAYPPFQASQRPIYVGTSAVFERLPWEQVDLAIATSLDAQLAWPDFRSHEVALQQCFWLRNHVPALVLQTYAMEHPVVQALGQPFPAEWYRDTLTERRRWHYPPRGEYIRVIHPADGSEQIVTTTDAIASQGNLLIDREN
jgi:primosomal protein N' (replication factor Y)